jgi:hypothetical protein
MSSGGTGKRPAGAPRGSRAAPRSPRGGRKVSAPGGGARRGRSAPALGLVPRRRAASRPRSFPQLDGATLRQQVLFELLRARAAVLSAIQGLPPGRAEQPLATGTWSAKQTVLHLVARDQARLRELEPALRGVPASWQRMDHARMARVNDADVERLGRLGWDEAVRLLHVTRRQLIEELESVPDEPAEVWTEEHPFGWMLRILPAHDRHHAEIIQQWRAGSPDAT